MKVIIGGSGSTGSSLLKNILNRHEDIFAGGETSFFSKKMIYQDWDKAKSRVLKRKLGGLRSFGFHLYNGTDLTLPEYCNTEDEIRKYLEGAQSLEEFLDLFFSKALKTNQAKFWVEKTPANAACFNMFLDLFEDGKVIHMTRNPYDTIASLWARGYDLYYSVGIYLMNTASALSAKEDNRYLEVSYENLVSKPSKSVSRICDFLDIDFDKEMLKSKGEVVPDSQLSGWVHDETDNIGQGSLGRFAKLNIDKQVQILEATQTLRINRKGMEYYGIHHHSIEGICQDLGYQFQSANSRNTISKLKKDRNKDRLDRLKRGYLSGVHYPIDVI